MSKELLEQVTRQAAFIEQLEQTLLEFTSGSRAAVASEKVQLSGPWNTANPKMRVPFTMRLPEPLHLKLSWLAENIPNESMHSIALKALEGRLDELLEKYYKA